MPLDYITQPGNWGRFDTVIVQPPGAPLPQAFCDVELDPSSFQNGFTVTLVPPNNLEDMEAMYYTIDYGGGGAGVSTITNLTRRRVSIAIPGSAVRVCAWMQHEAGIAPFTANQRQIGVFVSSPVRPLIYPPTSTQLRALGPAATLNVPLLNNNERMLMMTSLDSTATPIPIDVVFRNGNPIIGQDIFTLQAVDKILTPFRVPEQATSIDFRNPGPSITALQIMFIEEY